LGISMKDFGANYREFSLTKTKYGR